ncbi:hypothetical protein NDU88_009477 [Pleurodeles waltl]|uniref:Uncharacterized protein n=1 Tax=Pleurodeles waltl TaxID=8319 RepID=A0AAV7PW20_PLEWA|nr:hypothetical protein NDU88_009477 [Pleurodeles waltl]
MWGGSGRTEGAPSCSAAGPAISTSWSDCAQGRRPLGGRKRASAWQSPPKEVKGFGRKRTANPREEI